jgi:hypothetical protein
MARFYVDFEMCATALLHCFDQFSGLLFDFQPQIGIDGEFGSRLKGWGDIDEPDIRPKSIASLATCSIM